MTVQHDQRYANACIRNVSSRLGQKPTADYKIAHFAGMELEDLKHSTGVRKNDNKFDLDLGAWLGKLKDHAVKAGIAAKAKKKQEIVLTNKEGTVIYTGIDADSKLGKDLMDAAPTSAPTTKIVYSAEDTTAHHAPAEKKVNPKKAQRQAALEASGTAPKKVNADTARAEKMAGMAKRQPRIMTKTQH